MNGHAEAAQDATILSRLQRLLILQATRTSIAHELEAAFDEQPTITDEALNRVIQISSVGLLEVKGEMAEILSTLEAQHGNECKEEIFCIKEVERLEKQRLEESIKGLQVGRLASITSQNMDDAARQDVERAVQDSKKRFVVCLVLLLPLIFCELVQAGSAIWTRKSTRHYRRYAQV